MFLGYQVLIEQHLSVERNTIHMDMKYALTALARVLYNNHDPKRNRKLLLNKREINKLIGRINREGYTLIPTKLYFKKDKAKVEIAVAKGKKQYDKRHTKKQRDWDRERARYFRKSS